MLQRFTELFGSLAICNRLDNDRLNSGNTRSNLWFALQSDSDLGPDWEGQMTHVSMIGKHDYKEKCGLVLVAREFVLLQSTNETLLQKDGGALIEIKLIIKRKLKKKKLTFFHNIQKPWLFKEGPLHGKSLKMLLAFYVLATPMWKDAKEWQSCCGTKWNNPRACRYRLGSVSARPKFFSPLQTKTVYLPVVQTSCVFGDWGV